MAMGTIHKNQRLVWHDLGERLASVQDQTSQTMNRLQILSQRVDQIAPSDTYTGHGVANVHSKMDTPM